MISSFESVVEKLQSSIPIIISLFSPSFFLQTPKDMHFKLTIIVVMYSCSLNLDLTAKLVILLSSLRFKQSLELVSSEGIDDIYYPIANTETLASIMFVLLIFVYIS